MDNKIDTLFLLVSTIDERIIHLETLLPHLNETTSLIVSHQITKIETQKTLSSINLLKKHVHVIYSSMHDQGVAKNRNETLKHIQPEGVNLILDDDIELLPNALEMVKQAFYENQEAELITFQILNRETKKLYKKYPPSKQYHTLRTLTGIGTTEIAFRSSIIQKYSITFDECFGPGAFYSIGEDFIFATDLYKKGCNMLFIPTPIISHPNQSTGSNLSHAVIFGRGALFARVFGFKSIFINLYFTVKKYTYFRQKMPIYTYYSLLTKGSFHYLFKKLFSTSCTN